MQVAFRTGGWTLRWNRSIFRGDSSVPGSRGVPEPILPVFTTTLPLQCPKAIRLSRAGSSPVPRRAISWSSRSAGPSCKPRVRKAVLQAGRGSPGLEGWAAYLHRDSQGLTYRTPTRSWPEAWCVSVEIFNDSLALTSGFLSSAFSKKRDILAYARWSVSYYSRDLRWYQKKILVSVLLSITYSMHLSISITVSK